MKNKKIKMLAVLGMSVAASMMLSYVESFIPFGVPGMKIGLANIFTVYLLYTFGLIPTVAVAIVRVLLTSLLFGNVMSLWYSLAGALVSIIMMTLIKKTDKFSRCGTSVVGGVSHNAAQIGVAVAVTGVRQIAFYMPVLIVSGTVSGIIIGLLANEMIKRLKINT